MKTKMKITGIFSMLLIVFCLSCEDTVNTADELALNTAKGSELEDVDCSTLDLDECRANLECEGKLYFGESTPICIYDDRFFPSNCPYEGCRDAGICELPQDPDGFLEACSINCEYNGGYAHDPDTHCFLCECVTAE